MITKITSHIVDAIDRLLAQYKDKQNINDIIEVIASQCQDFEDANYDMLDFLDIDNAEGDWLDVIGEIVGQDRTNFTDELYRSVIKAKIGRNISTGIYDIVISIFKLLAGTDNVFMGELSRATVFFESSEDIAVALEPYIKGFMQSSVGAGVRVDYVSIVDDDEPFIISSLTKPTPAEGDGFGGTTETGGGKLSKIFA